MSGYDKQLPVEAEQYKCLRRYTLEELVEHYDDPIFPCKRASHDQDVEFGQVWLKNRLFPRPGLVPTDELVGNCIVLDTHNNPSHFIQECLTPWITMSQQGDLKIDHILVIYPFNDTRISPLVLSCVEMLKEMLGCSSHIEILHDVSDRKVLSVKGRMYWLAYSPFMTNISWIAGWTHSSIRAKLISARRMFIRHTNPVKEALDRARVIMCDQLGVKVTEDRKLAVVHNDTNGRGTYYPFYDQEEFQRKLLNQDEVIQCLEEAGFECVVINNLKTMSVKDLVGAYADASVIIGPIGAHIGQCFLNTRNASIISICHAFADGVVGSPSQWLKKDAILYKELCNIDCFKMLYYDTEVRYEREPDHVPTWRATRIANGLRDVKWPYVNLNVKADIDKLKELLEHISQ